MTKQTDFGQNKKSTAWIWIVVAAVVLCLCCVLVAAVAAVFYLAPVQGEVFSQVSTVLPVPLGPDGPPLDDRPVPPVKVVMEPLDPDDIPPGIASFYGLVPDWEGQDQPGENTWQVMIPDTQPIAILAGWCTADQETLEQNFEHITLLLEVDGENIPVSGLYWEDAPGDDGVCRSYYGVVRAWPPGSHTVVQTMRIDRTINDGWSDYPAGDYVDRFQIIAVP